MSHIAILDAGMSKIAQMESYKDYLVLLRDGLEKK